jgi:hypothetical protein
MSENIRKLINAIEAGSTIEIEQNFEAAMAEKLSDAIEARKEAIASSLFVEPEEEAAEEEAVEEPEDDDSHGL